MPLEGPPSQERPGVAYGPPQGVTMGGFKSLADPKALRWLVVIGLVGAALLGWSWWQERTLMRRAVPVPATILEVDVISYAVGTGSARERNWRPVITYRFEFEGVTRTSRQVTPLDVGGSKSWAQELAARFHPGDDVEAHVDPEDPETSFLLPIHSWKKSVGFGVAAGMALVAGFFLWRRRRTEGDGPGREAPAEPDRPHHAAG